MTGTKRLLPLFLALVASILLGLCLGSHTILPRQLLMALRTGDPGDTAYRILLHIRLPRVWGALVAGTGLAVSGAIIQCILGNPLAGPNIIGVNSGAGLCVLLVSAFFPSVWFLPPLAAFAGAMFSTAIVLAVAVSSGFSRLTVILSGFALTTILGAGMNLLLILYPDAYVGSGAFLSGGLAAATAEKLILPTFGVMGTVCWATLCSRELNLLSLGAEEARTLGMRVAAWRGGLLMAAALLAGLVVSYAGLIGFVGLAAPHMARLLVGQDNRLILPASALLGALLVNSSDILARTLFTPYELPVGILLSMAGGIFFLWLLFHNRRGFYD